MITPLLFSCNEDSLLIKENNEYLEVSSIVSNTKLNQCEILEKCSSHFGLSGTRSSENLLVKDSITLDECADKSAVAYIVYCPTNDSSMIVSARNVCPFILAEASGDLSSNEAKRVIALFSNDIKAYFQDKVNNSREFDDNYEVVSYSTSNGTSATILRALQPNSPFLYYSETITYDTLFVYGPFVHTKWAQGSPYNSTLGLAEDGSEAVVGCGAVAVAQILGSLKHPSSITVNNLSWNGDWDSITSKPNANDLSEQYRLQIANLMKIIGKGVGMRYYSSEASGTTLDKIKNFLVNNLHFSITQTDDFSVFSIMSSLSNQKPVYCEGTNNNNIGHSWVIDGCRTIRTMKNEKIYECILSKPSPTFNPREWKLRSDTTYSTDQHYLRYATGDYGLHDGYYLGQVSDENFLGCTNNLSFMYINTPD